MSTSPLRTLAIRLLAAAAVLLAGTTPASAQLKNTPWPTFQHDKEHSGRSGQLGPLFPSGAPGPGAVKTLQVGDKIKSQPVIDSDGTIYVGSGWSFCAIHPAANTASGEMEMYPSTSLHGREAWCTRLGADNSAGASGSIDMRSYVYFVDRDNAMNAFDPDGNIVCRYRHGQEGDIKTTVGVNPVNGRLYFAPLQNFWGPGPLIATPPAPNCDFEDELWHYQNPTGSYISTSHPAFAVENGQHMIYIADTLGYLHKYRDDGNSATHLWQVKPGGGKISAAPTIGAGGSVIYIGSSAGFHAVNTSGGVIWTYPTLGWADQAAALGPDGTIYVGSKSGKSKRLYAINPNGSLKWEFGPIHSDADIGTFPIVAADGVVYAPIGTKVYSFDQDGTVLWSHQLNGYPINHPSIGGDATPGQSGTAILYVATGSAGTLYAISSARTGSGQNDPPVACIKVNSGAAHCNPGSTESAAIGETVTFSGASSQDTDPLTYAWNFGDGSTGTGQVVTHTYWSAGNRTVTLTVSDGLASDTNTVTMSVSSGGGGTPVSDNFNRGDNTTIGNGWLEEPGSDFVILGNELRNAAVKTTHIATQPGLTGSTLTAAANFASVNNNWGPRLGIILRYQGPGNYYAFYRQAGGSNAFRISKWAGGAETVLKSVVVSNLATNTFFRIQATANGQDLKLFLNEVEKVSVQDSTYSGGSAGLMIGAGSSSVYQHRADNFCAALGTSCSVAP